MRQFLNFLEDENIKRNQIHKILQEKEKEAVYDQPTMERRVRFEGDEEPEPDTIIAHSPTIAKPDIVMINHNGYAIEQNNFNRLHAIARARRLSRQCAGTSKWRHRDLDEALNPIHLWTGDSILTVDGYCFWADPPHRKRVNARANAQLRRNYVLQTSILQ